MENKEFKNRFEGIMKVLEKVKAVWEEMKKMVCGLAG
jgi:hypothetical protein